MTEETRSAHGIVARYSETDAERLVSFELEREGVPRATIAQNREGYAMVMVRRGGPDGDELERYYGLEMAVDHAAELLGVEPTAVPLPEAATDIGM